MVQNERQTITCTNDKFLSMLDLTLIHVSKRGPRSYNQNGTKINEVINGAYLISSMMTSSNGNIFRVIGPLCREFTGPRWIPHTKASDAELWCFLWSTPNKRLSKQMQSWWFETHSPPLWRHSNVSAWYLPRSYEKYKDNRTAYLRTHHSSFLGRTPLHIWHRGKRLCRSIFHSFDPDWCSILKIRWYQSAVRENHITLVYINVCRAEFILHNMKIY